jgi:hypothetical protein
VNSTATFFLSSSNGVKTLAELSQEQEQPPSEHLTLFRMDQEKIKAPPLIFWKIGGEPPLGIRMVAPLPFYLGSAPLGSNTPPP